MDVGQWQAQLQLSPAIAVIRAPRVSLGLAMAQSVAAAGIRLIEITWTSDRPTALIQQLHDQLPHCWIGAGTLLSVSDVEAAIAAGAQFCFMPHTDPTLIATVQSQGIPVIPGATTPTEIVAAWQAGATSVKVFPVMALGGATYIRQLQGPLGHIPLIPTGGVTLENGPDLLAAGAKAIALSSSLFPKQLLAESAWPAITQRTTQLLAALPQTHPEGLTRK
jgi:2-dehydro-3-deoxyphosphogluconate aldolase/(4S)-4-hydroxy-2-oxoglutarate aldolase